MAGVNKVILIGHLGRDPEIRRTDTGSSVASFSLATSETWRDKATGDRKERTEWHNVVIFNEGLIKVVEQYCKKGSKLYVEGQIRTREYTDRDGNKRKTTEIVLSAFRGEITLLESQNRPAPNEDAYGTTRDKPGRDRAIETGDKGAGVTPLNELIDDDIPF